jgi:hypothetical protein
MRGADLAEADLVEAMASAVDRIVSAREGVGALDRAIEAVVGMIGRFSGKNATSYLEAYRTEIVMRDIPEERRRLSGFPRVAVLGIHAEVLEVREECGTWEEFEGRLFEKYGHDDALRLSKHEFMEWVETPGKGMSASALLQEFEERFARLSALDRTVLDTSRVLLFVKSVDAGDREKIGLLLETDDGLTADWAVVKRVYCRFDKRRDWAEKDLVGAGAATTKKVEATPPAKKEETRRWTDGGSTSTGTAKGSSGESVFEELTQMVRDLQIAQPRRPGGEPVNDRKPPAGSRCLWCDAVGHARKDCRDFAEEIRANVVYLSNDRVHDFETRRMLDVNVGRGGMKRLMEAAAARHAETVHYSASAGIRVGGEESRKAKNSDFWPSVLEGLAGVRLKKEEADCAEKRVWEATGWSDLVEEKTGFVEATC